jgi:hypothetical protein
MVMCEEGQGGRSLLSGNVVGMVVRQDIKVRVERFSRKWLGPVAYGSILVFPQR